MDENRIPPALIVALVLVVLAIGAAAYYAGRFRGSARPNHDSTADLPPPAEPAPDAAQTVEIPADVPPTVTPSTPVVVERSSRSSTVTVEKSTQIVVPVPPVVPTAIPAVAPIGPDRYPTARRRIIIEVRPTLTPTVPEVELGAPPPPVPTPEPPPELEETPEPEPEPTARPLAVARPGSVRPGGSLTDRIGMDRALRVPGAAQQLVHRSRRDPGNQLPKRLAQLGSELLFQFLRSLGAGGSQPILATSRAVRESDGDEIFFPERFHVGVDLFGEIAAADGPELVETRRAQLGEPLAQEKKRLL